MQRLISTINGKDFYNISGLIAFYTRQQKPQSCYTRENASHAWKFIQNHVKLNYINEYEIKYETKRVKAIPAINNSNYQRKLLATENKALYDKLDNYLANEFDWSSVQVHKKHTRNNSSGERNERNNSSGERNENTPQRRQMNIIIGEPYYHLLKAFASNSANSKVNEERYAGRLLERQLKNRLK